MPRPGLMFRLLASIAGVTTMLAAEQPPSAVVPSDVAVEAVDYLRDVKPLLRSRCVSCHGPLNQEAGLRLDAATAIRRGADEGAVVVAGNPAASRMMARVRTHDPDQRMPPTGAALNDRELAILETWIRTGAVAPSGEKLAVSPRDHWAFQPLTAIDVPTVSDEDWPRNAIDRFVLAKLESRSWSPSPAASPPQLLRRVYLDLIGLPPTPEEQSQWLSELAASSEPPETLVASSAALPDAVAASALDRWYERVVRDLLARPSHGERYARHWLDVVRYADSNGYERDAAKPEVWRYRDYVIRAFNEDVPFDRFVLEQIAGDELEDADGESMIATGFHRLGPWDDEPADFATDRFDQLDDMVSVTSEAFLALTLGCARCHDHKFDPLSQRDYYSLVAVFNPLSRPQDGRTELTLPSVPPARRVGLSDEALKQSPPGYFLRETSPTAPATHILVRGNPHQPSVEVGPAVPAILDSGNWQFLPPSEWTSRRRLSLANWLVDPGNPLTARVIVNRVWQWHFGQGLARTPNDFGFNGQPPTHPELLDYLARWFVEEADWSLKKLHLLIVTSNTYRQSRADRPAYAAEDPENLLLWRRSVQRLEVEPIRDSMLQISGQLDSALFGPPIYPLVPREALESHADKTAIWPAYDPAAAARRTVYAFTKRSLMVPMLEVLDLCDTTRSTPRRNVTTVPTQALVLYNGGFTIEQAGHLARRLRHEAGDDWAAQIDLAWRLALCRPPRPDEQAAMLGFIDSELAHLRQLRGSSEHDTDADAEISDAARTQLGRVVFNLNEFVYPD